LLSNSIRRIPFDPPYLAKTLAFVAILVLTLSVPTAHAQSGSPPAETVTNPEEPSGPQPYAPADISAEAEATTTLAGRLQAHAEPDKALQDVRDQIPDQLTGARALLTETEAALRAPISARDFEDLQHKWVRDRETLADWRRSASLRAQALDADLDTLQALRQRWELTRHTAIETQLPAALVAVTDQVLTALREAEQQLGQRRSDVLTMQEQLRNLSEVVTAGLDRLAAAYRARSVELFSLEAPPLWKVLLHPPRTAEHAEQIRNVLALSWRQLGEFIDDEEGWLAFQVLVLVLVVGLLIYWRGRLGKLSPDIPHLDTTTRILAHPVSTALVLTITLGLLLYPEAPRPIGTVAMIILFLPLFRILPGEMLSRRKGLLAALFVLFLLTRIVDTLPYLSLLQRVLLLVECVAALLVLRYAVRKTVARESQELSANLRIVRSLIRVAMLLLFAAIVLNIIGNVGLPVTLASAVIMAGFGAVILIAAYLGFRSLLWIGLNSSQVRSLRMVQRHDALLSRRILAMVRLVMILVWVWSVLGLLQIQALVLGGLQSIFTAQARFGEIGISLGDVLSFVVTIWAAVLISRFVRFVLDEDIYWRLKLPRGVPHAFSTAVNYTILLAAFFLAVAAAGVQLSKITLLAGAFGVGIGFGLQNIVNNFISGLILVVERPILPGDTVQIGELTGEVKRIGMRSSTVRTWDGAEVIVPNGNLISSEVINWTLSDRVRRVNIDVGVAYGTDPTAVMDLLVSTAKTHESVLSTPEPHVLFLGFGDSSLNFQLRLWTGYDRFLRTKSEVTVAVEKALKDADITIPFPQRDLHVKSVAPEARGVLPEAKDDKTP
jgi:small-conductance mechanosensitive channel